MIKVVHIQYSSSSAGSAALKLQRAFLKAEIDSHIISLHPDTNGNEKVQHLGKFQRLKSSVDGIIQSYLTRKKLAEWGSFSYPVLGANISKIEKIRNADFIYLHWVLNGFLNLKSIEQLAKLRKPLIIFLHDMWPITGGCHHSFDCEKYKTACNDCPMFSGAKRHDLSYKEFIRKKKLYSKYNNFYFIAPSQWMYDCATQSALLKGKPVFRIPNMHDHSMFKPIGKDIARNILNIDYSETIIGFGAVSLKSPYKGWIYLKKALYLLSLKEEFKSRNISVLIFGSGFDQEITDAIPFKTRFVGYLHDEYSKVLVYNSMDVFITPSIADNFPYTTREALSSGVPVVGFNTGGISNLIQHKKNGYLAKYKDETDIESGIEFCLQNKVSGYELPGNDPGTVIKKHLELFDFIASKKEVGQ